MKADTKKKRMNDNFTVYGPLKRRYALWPVNTQYGERVWFDWYYTRNVEYDPFGVPSVTNWSEQYTEEDATAITLQGNEKQQL